MQYNYTPHCLTDSHTFIKSQHIIPAMTLPNMLRVFKSQHLKSP